MKNLWKDRKALRANLQRQLPKLVHEYFASGRAALQPGTSWTEMHRFRLESKRFRYTLEIFRPAYGPGLEHYIDAVKKVQTFLGDINDCVVTSAMLEAYPETESVRQALAEKAEAKTLRLRSYWEKHLDAPGQEAGWVRYLRTYVCRKRPQTRSTGTPAIIENAAEVAETNAPAL